MPSLSVFNNKSSCSQCLQPSPALGSQQPHVMLQVWGRVAGKWPSGKSHRGVA